VKIIDQILCGAQVAHWYYTSLDLRSMLVGAVVFNVDNVATFASSHDYFRQNALTGVRAPFAKVWLEGYAPVKGGRFGCYIVETPKLQPGEAMEMLNPEDDFWGPALRQEGMERAERLHTVHVFIELDQRISWIGTIWGAITEEGRCIGSVMVDTGDDSVSWRGRISEAVYSTCHLAFAFANCRNVSMPEVEIPEKLRKAHERRHGIPLTRYRVLQIGPKESALRTEGRSGEVGIAKALHICRGHFKTYTHERPLMGSRVGTFWWSAHTRGDIRAGVVVKDYAISDKACR